MIQPAPIISHMEITSLIMHDVFEAIKHINNPGFITILSLPFAILSFADFPLAVGKSVVSLPVFFLLFFSHFHFSHI